MKIQSLLAFTFTVPPSAASPVGVQEFTESHTGGPFVVPRLDAPVRLDGAVDETE